MKGMIGKGRGGRGREKGEVENRERGKRRVLRM
jgi:hypothetical protein